MDSAAIGQRRARVRNGKRSAGMVADRAGNAPTAILGARSTNREQARRNKGPVISRAFKSQIVAARVGQGTGGDKPGPD